SSSVLVQEGIHKILESEGDIEIISSASNQVEIIPLIRQNKPDLLLVDTALPKLDVEQLLGLIEREGVDTNVILLLHAPDERLIINSLPLGVRGFLTEASNQEQFIQAVRAVTKGEIWAEVKLITKILTQLLPSQKGFKRLLSPELTNKEEEVVKLIVQGLSNKQIAKKLYVSERTVKAHLRNMFKKFGVSSRFQLAMRFQNIGVSKPET
ncbi:MAG TPA: response regulator transcription factor, partial [Thermodesulfobacteriota bacterium]|nr:response regulator transcription factor [Thermodesulfobacteriota bacterium]